MSYDGDPAGARVPTQMIGEERKRIQEFRRQIHRERFRDGVSSGLHDDFAAEILSYYDTLREFRDGHDDDFPDISPLRSRVGRQVEVEKTSKRRGRDVYFEEVPAVRELPISYLLELSHDLDDVAQLLGFGAQAAQSTPHNEAGTDDLKALLETRGQTEAVGNLPGEKRRGDD